MVSHSRLISHTKVTSFRNQRFSRLKNLRVWNRIIRLEACFRRFYSTLWFYFWCEPKSQLGALCSLISLRPQGWVHRFVDSLWWPPRWWQKEGKWKGKRHCVLLRTCATCWEPLPSDPLVSLSFDENGRRGRAKLPIKPGTLFKNASKKAGKFTVEDRHQLLDNDSYGACGKVPPNWGVKSLNYRLSPDAVYAGTTSNYVALMTEL